MASPHSLSPTDVLAELSADAGGLSSADAQVRLERFGPNKLPEPKKRNPVLAFLSFFNDILIYILLGSAVLKALLGEWIDFAIIIAVAIINSVIGFLQEGRAEKAIDGIRNMLSADAQVLRDGSWATIAADSVVPGDIVRVGPGAKVPADIRLITSTSLRVEEAALTGESVPASKSVKAVDADAGIGDRTSMLFSGTIVTAGQAEGVVTATGSGTEIGAIQTMISNVDSLETPLTKQLRKFGTQLSVAILGMAAVMVLIGRYVHEFDVDEIVSAAIGFAVAAIPEGLPALVTITLALGVQSMAKRNAITRQLTAVETLGSVTTICSDKTGTLTKNEMTATVVVTGKRSFDVSGTGYEPVGDISLTGAEITLNGFPDLRAVIESMAVCNDAQLAQNDEGRWTIVGEPTEGALRTLGVKAGFAADEYERVAVLPFDSANKYMATLSKSATGEMVILVKGAPDRLLDRSIQQLSPNGKVKPLERDYWQQKIDELSDQGLRVLAAASLPAGAGAHKLKDKDIAAGLTFRGLVGIIDPPRPEAIEAIAKCHAAGIGVKMITGDHAGTAVAIARQMGIVGEGDVAVLTGAELAEMSQEKLKAVVQGVNVFARTSPEHKIRIVSALQAKGEVVSMTGDGVNDAPALRKADVGVAMGIKGTEATKEAAEIVLADDNFASIERAVEEGRRIYDNLRKSVVFLLPTNGAQSLVILLAVLFGFTLPLQPTQVLWINMVTAITLSLALAYEPAEPDIMARMPRKPGGSILPGFALAHVLVVSLLIAGATLFTFFFAQGQGAGLAESQTIAVQTLAFGQLFYLFNCRFLSSSSFTFRVFEGNWVIWAAVGVLVVFQVIFVYVPVMHTLFGSAALGFMGWALPIVMGLVVFALVEAVKVLGRKRGQLTA